jgi:hypothetical protein
MKLIQFISRGFIVTPQGPQPLQQEIYTACENLESCRAMLSHLAEDLRTRTGLPETTPIQFITRRDLQASPLN